MGLFPDPPTPPIKAQSLELPKTVAEIRRLGKKQLLELIEPALKCIERAIQHGDPDDQTAVKAAFGVLDRTGFGPHSTVTVEDANLDYSPLTMDEAMERHRRLLERLDLLRHNRSQQTAPTSAPSSAIH